MADFSKNTSFRGNECSKIRQYRDELQYVKTPLAIRKMSETIDNESKRLEGQIRKFIESEGSIGDDPEAVSLYVDPRYRLVEDLEAHYKEAHKLLRDTGLLSGSEESELKAAAWEELSEADSILLRERAALAIYQTRLKNGIFGQSSKIRPGKTHKMARLGKAYRLAVTQNLTEPGGLSYIYERGISGADRVSFKNRLIKVYNSEGSKFLATNPDYRLDMDGVCPISWEEDGKCPIKVAHIVPYSVGEANASYLFGSKPDEGYNIIWSEKNGLLLSYRLRKIFDEGRMIILPDPTGDNEFISFILCQEILKKYCFSHDTVYSTFHKKRLQFQTSARPGKRYLWVHALLSLFRRRQCNAPGWEQDRERVFGDSEVWATPGETWARRSMISTLAWEMGDDWGCLDAVGGLGDFPDAKSPGEERRIAILVKYGWETRPKCLEFIDYRDEIADPGQSDTPDYDEDEEDEDESDDDE